MKRVIVVLISAALMVGALTALAACGSSGSVPSGAIATVNGTPVTQQQFDQIVTQAKAQYKSQPGAPAFPKAGTPQYDQLKASIVNYLVQNEVINQEAKKLNITVTDKELTDRIAQITKQVGGQKKLDALLKQQAVTMADLKTQLKAQMLMDKVRAKQTANIKITDAQIAAYYNDPANKAQFVQPETVTARHVLVKTLAEANKVRALLLANNTNSNWAAVAKQYSIDPGSKNAGGDLGAFPKGRMVAPFEKVAFSIKPGTVSDPVKTQFGYHIIEVTKKTPGTTKTLAQVKTQLQQTLAYQQQATAWTSWLKKTMATLGVKYSAGFDPATLTASPSPSGSPSPSASK